jgi:hypothetical protein
MVNFVEAQKPLLSRLMKMAGLRPIEIALEPGTTMHIWAPNSQAPRRQEGHHPARASCLRQRRQDDEE